MSGMRRKAGGIDDPIPSHTPSKRSRRSLQFNEAENASFAMQKCAELVDRLRNHKIDGIRPISETFIRAPSRRTDPDYFKVVTHPIDLTRIQQKVKCDEYSNFNELSVDVRLLVSNNKAYYKEGSQEYIDACKLWDIFESNRKKLFDDSSIDHPEKFSKSPARESGSPETSSNDDKCDVSTEVLEEIIASTLELTDETGRLLSPPFRLLLPPEKFPTYYARVKNPIDLRAISEKIRCGHYQSWSQFDADFKLLCKNAKAFNEPGSIIHKDATAILKNYTKMRIKLCTSKPRLSSKKIAGNTELVDELLAQSAVADQAAAYSEDSGEDEDTEQSDDPKWILYWKVRNAPNPSDPETSLAEFFLELPNKSWYPDYYDEITVPMSFFMIHKKLKRNMYSSLDEVLNDMILIFENARTYNLEGSDIYDATLKLEKLARASARALESKNRSRSIASDPSSETSKQESKKPIGIKCEPEITCASSSSFTTHEPSPIHSEDSECKKLNRPGRKSVRELLANYQNKLLILWDAVYNHVDDGRRLSNGFMHLPSRIDDPDYFTVIQNPIDLTTVKQKIDSNQYMTSNELMEDMDLLFHNAWSFNEPGSQIYRDATVLQALARNALSSIPDAPVINPIYCKQMFGWIRTKLSPNKRLEMVRNVCSRNQSNGELIERAKLCAANTSLKTDSPQRTVDATMQNPLNNSASKSTRRVYRTPAQKSAQAKRKVMLNLFESIKNLKDSRGRDLATPFLQLPSKLEYPDYYDVIRKPIDLTMISNRIKADFYESIEALINDFSVMFDNACRYNEPDSALYKDALSLQKLILQKKKEYCSNLSGVPNVQQEVQLLLSSILISVNNHQDSEGRCYSDSLVDLPALLRRKGIKPERMPFSLDELRRNVSMGRYRRLDKFQTDLFDLFDSALANSHSESQMFDDVIRLQMHYLKTRDDLTRQTLFSPARLFTEEMLLCKINALRKQKLAQEAIDDEENAKFESLGPRAASFINIFKDGDVDLLSIEQGGQTFSVNDYAYISPANDEEVVQRHIMRIERIYRDSDGQDFVRGVWFHRPEETYHLATRKFFENEVFLTSYYDTVTVDRLVGRCFVMPLKNYIKEKPMNFDSNDVYICECRYMGRQLHFKKLKNWPFKSENESVVFEKREKLLNSITRVSSVFANIKPSQSNVDIGGCASENVLENEMPASSFDDDRLKNLPPVLELERMEVIAASASDSECGEKVVTFYEQVKYNNRWFKLGDFVYVYNPLKNRTAILRINRMWMNSDHDGFFSGSYFARPRDLEHEPARMFYKNEVFAVDQPDITVPMENIQGNCEVMLLRDYVKCRPTEIDEADVYVVEYIVRGRESGTLSRDHQMLKAEKPFSTFGGTESHSVEMMDESGATKSSVVVGEPPVSLEAGSLHSDSPSTSQRISVGEEYHLMKSDGNEAAEPSPSTLYDCSKPMSESSARKLRSLKTYQLSTEVVQSEIYIFKGAVKMEKVMSPLLAQGNSTAAPSEALDDIDETASESNDVHDQVHGKEVASWLALQPKLNSRSKSGYILFSAEVRKRVMQENPDAGFGEVSKIVGIEWKNLPEENKKQYEVRAEYIAKERAKHEPRQPVIRLMPGQIRIYICKWQTCDFQFQNSDDLYEHVKTAHTSQIVEGENQYVCLWASCLKYRKDGKPFPSLPRLHRHIKEKHVVTSGKSIYPNQRSKNFVPVYTTSVPSSTTGSATFVHVQQPITAQQQGQHSGAFAQSPMAFVAQAVVASNPQIITNGYVNGTAVAVAPTAYLTTAPSGIVHANAPHGYHPYQVRQVSSIAQSANASTYAAIPVQATNYTVPSTSQQPPLISDPGRTVVQAPKPAEPVFVSPVSTVQVKRVMHSEVYLRYIESLSNSQQHSVSKWHRSLLANQRTCTQSQKTLPTHFLSEAKESGAKEEVIAKALWRLRDFFLESTLNIVREADYAGPL